MDEKFVKLGEQLDKKRYLLRRIQNVYEMERREWARLLHDDFGQSLAAINSFAVAIKNDSDKSSENYYLADIIQTTASELYVSTYDLMRGLRSGFIEDMGLLDSVQVCIENSRLQQKNINTNISTQGNFDNIENILKVIILRIVQESLSGIVRNSMPEKIDIFLALKQHNVTERRNQLREKEQQADSSKALARKIIEVSLRSTSQSVDEEINIDKSIFQRIQNYVEAFGGDYSFVSDKSVIEIKMNMDVTDIIEEAHSLDNKNFMT